MMHCIASILADQRSPLGRAYPAVFHGYGRTHDEALAEAEDLVRRHGAQIVMLRHQPAPGGSPAAPQE